MLHEASAAVIRWTRRVARTVTAVAMFLGLVLTYFLGVLVVRLLAGVVGRGLLGPRRRVDRPSYWEPARGLSANPEDLLHPS